MEENDRYEYKYLINHIISETRYLIDRTIEIYIALKDQKIELPRIGKITEDDHVPIALLFAQLDLDSNISKIFNEYDISLDRVMKRLNIRNLEITEIPINQREKIYNQSISACMEKMIKFKDSADEPEFDLHLLSPEYIMWKLTKIPLILKIISISVKKVSDAIGCLQKIDDIAIKNMGIRENSENSEIQDLNHTADFFDDDWKDYIRDNQEDMYDANRKNNTFFPLGELSFPFPLIDFFSPTTKYDERKDSHKKENQKQDMDFFSKIFESNNPSLLEKYGDDLTSENSKVFPAIGREKELENVMIGLVTGSSLLLGDAGVGKTAIVEGLAYLIKNDLAPKWFKNKRIIQILTDSLKSNSHLAGTFEERMNGILKESLEDENVIIFIDEIHTAMGYGLGGHSMFDIANSLKPYLTKGLRMIGATTKAEYEEYIKDEAFRRRFKCVEVKEPNKDQTYHIIEGSIRKLEDITKVNFKFDQQDKKVILNSIVDVTNRKNVKYNDPEYNPSISISILSEAFSHAAIKGKAVIDVEDICYSIKSCDRLYESVRKRQSQILMGKFKQKIPKVVVEDENKIITFTKR